MSAKMDLFGRAVESFGTRVDAIGDDQWASPTPCTDWDVRALVNHLVGECLWVPPLVDGLTVEDVGKRFDGDLLGGDPKKTWELASRDAGTAFHAVPADTTVRLSYGVVPAERYALEIASDLTVHSWDLARAIGADERLDGGLVALVNDVFGPMAEQAREMGLFGAEVKVPDGADEQTKMLAKIGRAV